MAILCNINRDGLHSLWVKCSNCKFYLAVHLLTNYLIATEDSDDEFLPVVGPGNHMSSSTVSNTSTQLSDGGSGTSTIGYGTRKISPPGKIFSIRPVIES